MLIVILLLILRVHAQCDDPAGFVVHPVDQEITLGTNTSFNCSFCNTSAVHISWIINDEGLNQVQTKMILGPCVPSQPPNPGHPSVLNMTAGSKQCNGTKVKCVAFFQDPQHDPQMVFSDVAELTVLDLEEIEKLKLQKFNNGSILISWDAITITSTLLYDTEYRIEIYVSNDMLVQNVTVPSNSTQTRLNYHFLPVTRSVCNIYNIYVTPILNSRFKSSSPRIGPVNESLYEEISSIPFANLNSVSLINNSTLEYVIILSDAVPVCTFTLNIVNDVTNNSLPLIERGRPDNSSATNILSFQIGAIELPFNERYTASITLNGAENSKTVTKPIKLSTYDILDVSRDLNVVSFVTNTAARGAFVVSIEDSINYTHIAIRREANQLWIALEEEMQSYNNCNILFYDIESNGQLNLTTKELWPAFEIEEHSCIVENNTDQDLDNSNVSANVYIENGHVIFECRGLPSDEDLMGCVAIIHSHNDYPTMYVDTVEKNSNLTVTGLDNESNHSFAAFPWRTKGLIGSKMIPVQVKTDESEPESVIEFNIVIPIAAGVTVSLIIMISIVMLVISMFVVRRHSENHCKVCPTKSDSDNREKQQTYPIPTRTPDQSPGKVVNETEFQSINGN